MMAEWKKIKLTMLGSVLLTLAIVTSCSKDKKEPYYELKFDLSLVDQDGNQVDKIAKDQTTQVYVSVSKGYQSQSAGVDVTVLSSSCVDLSSSSLNLSSVMGIQYSHSEPLIFTTQEKCKEGENAVIVFELRDPGIADQSVTSLINLKIESSSEIPRLSIADFFLNGARHSAVYPSQEFSFSFRLNNDGEVNIRELQVDVEPVGPLENLEMQSVGQNKKIAVGESSVFSYPEPLKIMPYLGEANAVAFIIRWYANKNFSGEEMVTIPIVSPISLIDIEAESVIKLIPADLKEIPEPDPDNLELPVPPTQKYEFVEVGFTLKNETDFSFGPGEIKIVKISRGEIEGYYDLALFGDIPAAFTYKVSRGTLRIKPIGNAKIITLKLEMRTKCRRRSTNSFRIAEAVRSVWFPFYRR